MAWQLHPTEPDTWQVFAAWGQCIVPLGDWDGETTRWGPTEFWACYCGLRPVPARWGGL